jgi:spermidine synthase
MEIEKYKKDFGNHIILDLYDSDVDKLYYSDENLKKLIDIVTCNNGTIQNVSQHIFPNNAFTVLFLLSESHVSYHTFPENKYIAIDIFTCGQNVLTYNIATLCIHYFKSTNVIVNQIIRNNFNSNQIPKYVKGDYMSNESVKNVLFSGCNIICDKQTPYQHLMIIENEKYGKILLLDNYIMHISSIDTYSDYMISSVDSSIEAFSNILIIGGGDFIIANRMMCKYSNLNIKIDIVDIDKAVSDAVIAHFNYTLPSNCNIEYQCGYEYIKKCQKKYDAIILDITDPAEMLNTPASVLMSEDFYINLLRCANDSANIIQQYGSYEYFKTNLNTSLNVIFPDIIKNQKFSTKYMDEYFDELIFLHILN